MSSRRDGRHSGVKIYVGNLPKEENRIISADKISNLFSRCGTVNNIWIAKKPPGFAFVEYADQRDAEDAVKSLNKYEIEPDYPIGNFLWHLL
jgi:arginine/serine-rich splicing factor 3